MIKPGIVSQGKASVIWRASHSAVGLVVTPIHRRRRRPSPKMTNTNSMAKDEDFGFQSFTRTKAVPHISEQKSEEGRNQFDHDPILFSTANPEDEVFGRHRPI